MMLLIGAGALVGLGLFLLIRQLIPTQPQLADALHRLHPDQVNQRLTAANEYVPATEPPSLTTRIGAWTARNIGHRPGISTPTKDLEILKITPAEFFGQKASSALVGLLLIPILTGLGSVLPALAISPVLPAGFGLLFAALFWFLPDSQVKSRAASARAEFVRVTVAYLQLVAIKRSSGGAAVETMTTAASISDSWVMVRIRQELTRAQWAGIPPWDALNALGDRISISEISEVGDIMRLAGEEGATVKDTLLARATSLQGRLLNDEQIQASGRTNQMTLPITALAGLFILAILIPVVLSLTTV